ncbi:MAG: hypothetical protein LBS01_01545 [Prevotellaceae bacterium]|nr:hypothetical protein [Prevotellaceae bacterium]
MEYCERFFYAESRKTTKFIELCAPFVSFVVNFFTTKSTKKFTRLVPPKRESTKLVPPKREKKHERFAPLGTVSS